MSESRTGDGGFWRFGIFIPRSAFRVVSFYQDSMKMGNRPDCCLLGTRGTTEPPHGRSTIVKR